jgi:iron complex outermembrane receptor protein
MNNRSRNILLAGISTFTLGLASADLANAADTPADAPPSEVETIIVTGTRVSGLKAVDSAAPIQVVDSASLKRAGKPDLIAALAQAIPSFNAQSFGGDTAALTLSARLRGLSANHTLVLVNGKRRHGTANLAVLGGPYQGGAAADLNFIPLSAIDHIEVLTDGAAAQYGTDAIAGVVNIILKKNTSGGSLDVTAGRYYGGDGKTGNVSGNIGLSPFANSYLSLTAETRYHDFSDWGGDDQRVVRAVTDGADWATSLAGYPHTNKISGDARYQLTTLAYNSGVEIGDLELYSFGTYGHKYAGAYENFRTPTRLPELYPLGFNPMETIKEEDYAVTGGIKGKVFGDWDWDLSSTYGRDFDDINVTNSVNKDLYLADSTVPGHGSTQSAFDVGAFLATQWTTTLDVSRPFDVGLAGPLNVAFGVEQRHETYKIKSGEYASRYIGGSQSYPGFSLTDAGKHERDNVAAYLDLAVKPVEALQLDAAVRYEHFSDFGDTTVGKLTGRYDFSPAFALRGTASTGFRAPTLAEEYYSATNVGPSSAYVQLAPNSAAAKLIGVNGLKPEKSTNYSVGFVTHPIARLTATLDVYQIEVRDRIAGSGTLCAAGCAKNYPAVAAAIKAAGNSISDDAEFIGINIFSNGLDTRTRGVEAVVTYATSFGEWGKVDWSLAANYNKTEVTKIAAAPAELGGALLYDRTSISDLETASPEYKISGGALYSLGPVTINLHETYYGLSSEDVSYNGGGKDGKFWTNKVKQAFITDLEVDWRVMDQFKISAGANNLFDRHPHKKSAAEINDSAENGNGAQDIYSSISPYGLNGGYYYAKFAYSF